MARVQVGTNADGSPIWGDDGLPAAPAPAPAASGAGLMSMEAPGGGAPRVAMNPNAMQGPPPQGPPMPSGLDSPGVGQSQAGNQALDAFYARELQKLYAKQGQGGGVRVAAKPETEQRTSVQRQRSMGPSAESVAELDRLQRGAPPLEQLATPKPTYSAREIAALTEAPPEAKTEKQKQAYYEGIARDLTAKGIDLATAEATGIFTPRKPPAQLAKIGGGVVDQWKADEAADRQSLISAIDARSKQAVEQASMVNQAKRAESEQWAERYGQGGLQGIATAAAKADQRLADAQVGAAETKSAADVKFQEERARLLQEQQAKVDKVFGDIDRASEDIKQTKIDPNRFWSDRSTAERIGLAIAQAVGTFASAYGVKNDAAGIIKDAVDRDLQAQIQNMADKRGKMNDLQSLYKRVLDDTGNKVMAADAMRLAAYSKVEAELGEAAATATSEKAQLRVQEVANKMQQEQVRARMEAEERMRGTESAAFRVDPAKAAYVTGPVDNTKRIEEILHKRLALGEGAAKLDLATGAAAADMLKAQGAAKGKAPNVLTINGQEVEVKPGVPESIVEDRMKKASYASALRQLIKDVRKEADRTTGFLAPSLPGTRGVAAQTFGQQGAAIASQIMGAGVPSEREATEAAAAIQGRNREDLLKTWEALADQADKDSVQMLGGRARGAAPLGNVDPKAGKK